MRKRNSSVITLIIAFLCIAVYAVALAAGAYRFVVNIIDRQIVAEREFYDLADTASAAGVLGFMDVPFQETIQDSLTRSQTLEGVIISGPSGEYAFERERGAIIRWEGDSPRFVKRFGVSSTSAVPLRINGLRNVNISAGFHSLDYDYGITILKHSLIIILAALATAFLTFLIESVLVKDPVPVSAGRRRRRGNTRLSRHDDEEAEETAFEPAGSEVKRPEAGFQENPDFAGFDPDLDFMGDSVEPAGNIDIPEWDLSPEAADLNEPELPDSGETEAADLPELPHGLYDPESNLGWEEYTNDRLESELHRCASFEQDLTVMVAAFTGNPELTREQYKQFADMAIRFFNLQDLLFEKGTQGITVILPDMDLDEGFTKAEDFLNYLLPAFPDVSDFHIGVSARTGRLVDANRLYFEATEALNKAQDDPASPIIAFKSDPDKYQAFLRSRKA
ncbi:MAG: hypothetical protein LBH70_02175 [Spirochaetaceae bacterium]|jgi:hypothetical protein|nr:hypothetical protein [Spirochaetaceae bacterium]